MNDTYLSAIMGNTNNIVFFLNKKFEILKLNNHAKTLFNWTEKQALNKDFLKLCKQHKLECPITLENTMALAKNESRDIETCIKSNNQETFLRWEITPIANYEFILTGYDITELKQEQEKNFQLDNIIA